MPGFGHDSTVAVDAVELDQDLSANPIGAGQAATPSM
jgi:hypothetical protein